MITEIALLRLTPPLTPSTPSLLTKLAHANIVNRAFTGHSMSFFQSLSSPSLIYIFGSWESLDQHMNHFIPSAPNQATLKSLQGDVSVEWLLHVGVERGEMGLPGPGDGGVVGVRREVVEGREDGREVERRVEKDEREGRIEGGWRVDGVDGREEWVEVCVFGSGKEYDEFERKAGNEDGSGGGEVGWAKVLDI